MESNPSPETSPALAGSAAKTARSLNSDSLFDKKARELIEATSTEELDVESGVITSEGHSFDTAEENDLDVHLDEYLSGEENNALAEDDTEEEAEQQV